MHVASSDVLYLEQSLAFYSYIGVRSSDWTHGSSLYPSLLPYSSTMGAAAAQLLAGWRGRRFAFHHTQFTRQVGAHEEAGILQARRCDGACSSEPKWMPLLREEVDLQTPC